MALNDSFAGTEHVGLASAGSGTLYFAVAGTVNQVWRYTKSTGAFAMVASGGVDRNGANAASFPFVAGKSNMLNVDPAGNLWIGDDTANGTTSGTGRIWTISSAVLSSVGGGVVPADPAVVAAIRGPWFVDVDNVILTATFNADGTFTATISTSSGVTSDAGTYTVTGPVNPSPALNPQGHLNLTNSAGRVLIEGDVLLFKPDRFEMTSGTDSISPLTSFGLVIWAKFAA